ncbi:hypothetical protein ASZ90_019844 [hydrocarbon metagenome]|uniref:Uncharacterized protein n=1 Tax=hydrocarbon metagenome TaxID=938273 RepID=A0A0W8E288_9ZZZZ
MTSNFIFPLKEPLIHRHENITIRGILENNGSTLNYCKTNI